MTEAAVFLTGRIAEVLRHRTLWEDIARRHTLFVAPQTRHEPAIQFLENIGARISQTERPDFTPFEWEQVNRRVSVLQWWRFNQCVGMLEDFEAETNTFPLVIKKLRADFNYKNPNLLAQVQDEVAFNGLYCKTDLLFSGRREFVLPLRGLLAASIYAFLPGHFSNYFPLNPWQVQKSDDSTRWYWSRLPSNIFPEPRDPYYKTHVTEMRRLLDENGHALMDSRLTWGSGAPTTSGLGNAVWPGERVFAQYLNFLGTPVSDHQQFKGRLTRRRMGWRDNLQTDRRRIQAGFRRINRSLATLQGRKHAD